MDNMDARCFLSNLEHHGFLEDPQEIYIHFYTVLYPETPDTLSIYWYKNQNEHFEIFEDCKLIFQKMKEYKLCTTYTGDVFCIKHESLFMEQLLLLGIEQKESSSLHLINGVIKEVHCGKTKHVPVFNDTFDICFQGYDICQSFSSAEIESPLFVVDKSNRSSSLSSSFCSMDSIEIEKMEGLDKHLMIIDFLHHRLVTSFIKLRTILYSIFHATIDNQTMNKWFLTMVYKKQYPLAVERIFHIQDHHAKQQEIISNSPRLTSPMLHEDSSKEEESYEQTEQEQEQEQEQEKKSSYQPKEWIRWFCDLYLEPTKECDILLSELYREYQTASSWTNTPVVSMANFIKTVRSLDRFSLKRRSKGMTLLGHRSLVSQQSRMCEEVKQGQEYHRNLLHYRSTHDIQQILDQHQQTISSISHPFTKEVCLLWNETTTPFSFESISQFCSIPFLSSSLSRYAEYLEHLLSKPLRRNDETELEEFRDMSQQCVLYYPFQKGYLPEKENHPLLTISSSSIMDHVEQEVTLEEQFSNL
jgi:hypothetical protein